MILGYEIDPSSTTSFVVSLLPVLFLGLRVTVLAMVTGFALALVVGAAFTVLRRSSSAAIAWPTVIVVEFLRNTPLLIQLFFLYFVLPEYGIVLPAFWTGTVALGLQYGSYISEVYRAGLEALPRGQWEASSALNLSRSRTYRTVILPQIVPRVLPALGNYLISMMKDTAILSTITVVEMVNLATRIGDRTFEYTVPLSTVGGIFLVLTTLCSLLLHAVERLVPAKGIPLR